MIRPKNQAITHLITQDPQRKWHLEDAQQKRSILPSTLRRHLSKEGVSFCQLLLDVRMGIALNYLTFSNYSVFQVVIAVVLVVMLIFVTHFKRKYGMTPSQFHTQSRQANDPNAIATMASQNDESIKKVF